jgi:hypothetical protein
LPDLDRAVKYGSVGQLLTLRDRRTLHSLDVEGDEGREDGVNLLNRRTDAISVTEIGQALVSVDEGLRSMGRAVGRLETSVRDGLDQVEGGLNDRIEDLWAELDAARAALSSAIEAADQWINTGAVSVTISALARLDAGVEGQFADLGARLDEIEATMGEPLPLDISGLLHVLESKLFIPLDEMADALTKSRRFEGENALVSVAARFERAVSTMEAALRPSRQLAPGPDQGQLSEVVSELARHIEALRRRISISARPANGELGPETIGAIADAVAARLSENGQRPGRTPAADRTPRPIPLR